MQREPLSPLAEKDPQPRSRMGQPERQGLEEQGKSRRGRAAGPAGAAGARGAAAQEGPQAQPEQQEREER